MASRCRRPTSSRSSPTSRVESRHGRVRAGTRRPGSLAARKALASQWEAAGDPRGALIRLQLDRATLDGQPYVGEARRKLDVEIGKILDGNRKVFAGAVPGLVDRYDYVRGLVGKVWVSGDRFLDVAKDLFAAAPVQHLELTAPITRWAELMASPYLARLVSLAAPAIGLGDREAMQLAQSKHAKGLRWIELGRNAIGRAGCEALAASPYLEPVVYLGLTGNPCDPTPEVTDEEAGQQVTRPKVAEELERLFGPRRWLTGPPDTELVWPPPPDRFAVH